MQRYRICYCTQDGKRFGVQDFEAANDAGAFERARTLALRCVPIFEVWHGERLVYRGDGRAAA